MFGLKQIENMHGHWFISIGATRTCIFRQCITFHPNNLVHLRLYQHSQGAQVGLFAGWSLDLAI